MSRSVTRINANPFRCELTPHGAYVWRFLYPLFNKFDCLSLLYSERLEYPSSHIDFGSHDRSELANQFLSRIAPHLENACSYLGLRQFCSYYDKRPALFEHEHAPMVYGYAMVLLDERSTAEEFLKKSRH